jgi:hypothetical protein
MSEGGHPGRSFPRVIRPTLSRRPPPLQPIPKNRSHHEKHDISSRRLRADRYTEHDAKHHMRRGDVPRRGHEVAHPHDKPRDQKRVKDPSRSRARGRKSPIEHIRKTFGR